MIERFLRWILKKRFNLKVVDPEEYRLIKSIENEPPWQGKPGYHWDDDVSSLIPDSLKEEAKSAPWNVRRVQ